MGGYFFLKVSDPTWDLTLLGFGRDILNPKLSGLVRAGFRLNKNWRYGGWMILLKSVGSDMGFDTSGPWI